MICATKPHRTTNSFENLAQNWRNHCNIKRLDGGREASKLEPPNAAELLETLEEWEAQLTAHPDLKQKLQTPEFGTSLPKLRGPRP